MTCPCRTFLLLQIAGSMQSYFLQDEIESKSPFLDPLLLNRELHLFLRDNNRQLDSLHEAPDLEEEISEDIAKEASIEESIELLLSGTAKGFSFSTDVNKQAVEIARLLKWLFPKLMAKINKPSLRAGYITHTKSFKTTVFSNATFLISLIDRCFDFKNRVVTLAEGEYKTWHSPQPGSIYRMKEYDTAAWPLLTKYWSAGGKAAPSTSEYWSAVFISWIMKEAGAQNLFTYSQKHIEYIVKAMKNKQAKAINPFYLYSIEDFIPRMQKGDLLCKGRSECSKSGLTYENVLTSKETTTHVDIITDINLSANTIRVVGGNICDNVDQKILTIIPKDSKFKGSKSRIINSDKADYFAGIGIGNA